MNITFVLSRYAQKNLNTLYYIDAEDHPTITTDGRTDERTKWPMEYVRP